MCESISFHVLQWKMVNFPFLIENQYNVKKYLLYFHKNKFERFLRRERNSARAIYLLYKSYSVLIDFFLHDHRHRM